MYFRGGFMIFKRDGGGHTMSAKGVRFLGRSGGMLP